MGLFNAASLESYGLGLFNQYSPVKLNPAGSLPVQATLPPTRTGIPAQDPLAGPGSNGVSSTGKSGTGLFSSGMNPVLLIVGSIVVVAAIVMIARR